MTIAALFCRHNSVYKSMSSVDVWDAKRDARLWPGGMPCIAHPPCAQWGDFAHFSRDVPALKALAPLAIEFVRRWGGVLEHPKRSKLWPHMNLPKPGGGYG
jgi:hypothetical protein